MNWYSVPWNYECECDVIDISTFLSEICFEKVWINAIIGFGLFTKLKISIGEFVTYYIGKYTATEPTDTTYVYSLSHLMAPSWPKIFIDAKKHGNLSKFINHSCNPNLNAIKIWLQNENGDLTGTIAFVAICDILPGEELTVNYHYLPPNCRCKECTKNKNQNQ